MGRPHKKRGFCHLPTAQTRQDRTGEIGFLLCLQGVRWEGATLHRSTQHCRIAVRFEPNGAWKMWPTSGAAAEECGSSGETKRESSGEEAEQADQLSLLFVSLHYSESRTGAFSSPSLTDPAVPFIQLLVSVRDRSACVRRSLCVTFMWYTLTRTNHRTCRGDDSFLRMAWLKSVIYGKPGSRTGACMHKDMHVWPVDPLELSSEQTSPDVMAPLAIPLWGWTADYN